MDYRWDRIIGKIVYGRIHSAAFLAITPEDLKSIGRLAAVEAEFDWDPEGGRSLSSWVYLNVEYEINKALAKGVRHLVEDTESWTDEAAEQLESSFLVRESLEYFQAALTNEEWSLLWLHHAEGYTCAELADKCGIKSGALRKRMWASRKKAVTLFEKRAR